ncbi:MAG: hypothetical protein RL754_18 [Bacteroidota bacterium]
MQLKLKRVAHKDIDFEKWDRCISAYSHPQPYGFSWYLNWVAPKWDALVHGDYEVIMPIFPRVKNRVEFTTRPYGTQQLGPYSMVPLEATMVEQLVQEAMSHFRYGEFFLGHGVPLPTSWTSQSLVNLELVTNSPYATLQKAYSKQCRRNLKAAANAAFEAVEWVEVGDVLQLWKDNIMDKTQITEEQLVGFKKVLEFCHYQKRAQIIAVRDEYNQVVAAQIWVVFQGRSTLLVNAATTWAKENGLPTYLIDQHIQSKAGQDHIIDFEGSNIEGLNRFYSGFGAVETIYRLHIENRLPLPLRWMKHKTTR